MSEQSEPTTDQTLSESLLRASVQSPQRPDGQPRIGASRTLPADDSGASPPLRLGRFEVHGEIGRGGMGAVLRGHDPALDRDLALKVLLDGRRHDAEALRRFHEEARIGGRLQHPGLVPVYELGAEADGRPFFAMKLVDGRTLSALLKARASPADDQPRFLTVFEQVCQAVAYAHASGIIHRDLKPTNVMVGAFGEVQVMDWGLAKALNGPPASSTTPPSLAPAGRDDESHEGAVLGTPAYMPPEQARGDLEKVGRRADVFGLGGILCEILTGKPPFAGENVSDTIGRAARGDLSETFARLDGCGADTELVGLAKACLAAKPEERPADGEAVAARTAAYRAGVAERLHKAELERAAAEARAIEERRRRRTQLALAGVVLLLLTLAGGGGLYVRQQRLDRQQAQERAQREVETAVDRDLAEVAERQGQRRWPEAWAALERAAGRLGESGLGGPRERVAAARRRLEQIRTDGETVARLEEALVQFIDVRGPQAAIRAFHDAFRGYGVDVDAANVEAAAATVRASEIREVLVSMLYQWATAIASARREDALRLARIALAADPDPWRRKLVEAAVKEDRTALLELAARADPAELSPTSAVLVANCLEIAGQAPRAVPLLREVQRRHPDDFLMNFALGECYKRIAQPPQPDEAVRFFTAANALRPGNAGVLIELGRTQAMRHRVDEAVRAFRDACRLLPDNASVRVALAFALREQGKLAEAEAVCRDALHLNTDDPDAHNLLRVLLRDQGKLTEAEAVCRDDVRRNPDDARAHCSLGFTLRLQGKIAASLDEFRVGRELSSRPGGWKGPTAMWLRDAERLVDLDRRLPDVLAGKAKPVDAAEQLGFANLCGLEKRFAAAVQLYAGALPADATDDPVKEHHYAAARYAILAAAAAKGEPERALLRGVALGWLRDDLAYWGKRLDGGKPEDRVLVEARMRLRANAPDLAAVRDRIDDLPALERAEWRKLWQAIDELLRRAVGPKSE